MDPEAQRHKKLAFNHAAVLLQQTQTTAVSAAMLGLSERAVRKRAKQYFDILGDEEARRKYYQIRLNLKNSRIGPAQSANGQPPRTPERHKNRRRGSSKSPCRNGAGEFQRCEQSERINDIAALAQRLLPGSDASESKL
jgi:hypothetical protein